MKSFEDAFYGSGVDSEESQDQTTEAAPAETEDSTSVVEAETEAEETDVQAESVETTSEESEDDAEDEAESEESGDSEVYDVLGDDFTEAQLAEMKDVYAKKQSLDKDYTQKSQANAEIKREAEAVRERYTAIVDTLESKLSLISELVDEKYKDIDWDYLREYDSGKFVLLEQEKAGLLNKAVELKAVADQVKANEIAEKRQVMQASLLDVIPEWKNEETMAADVKSIEEYMKVNGFTDSIANNILDHQLWKALSDAAKYRELKDKSVVTAKKSRKVLKTKKSGNVTKTKATEKKSFEDVFYG